MNIFTKMDLLHNSQGKPDDLQKRGAPTLEKCKSSRTLKVQPHNGVGAVHDLGGQNHGCSEQVESWVLKSTKLNLCP